MILDHGTKLGPYEILEPLGAGGMGEVYRARDTRLDRDVAIKICFAQFSERFEREARAIAALNHPHICALYDVGPNYLVMELVDGSTLASRLSAGPMPLEEALAVARQISEALDAAHEKCIVHRDLKPANIKITPEGVVKVLDFGLAKAAEGPVMTNGGSTNSPTATMPPTRAGVILGTAAYMAPEQARGAVVDKRADIWAFGCVLYEMLTAKRAFCGETTAEILAAVLKEEPNWSGIPSGLQRLLRGCLEKNPRLRLRDIGDAWRLLEEASEPAAPPRRSFAKGVAAFFLLTTALLAFIHFRETVSTPEPVRFQMSVPEKVSLTATSIFALSPDGRRLVFSATQSDRVGRLWMRTLDSLQVNALPDVIVNNPSALFWSPDSRHIAYVAGDRLKKIDISGGTPQTICDLPYDVRGGSWNRDGVMILGSDHGLLRVSAAGGAVTALTVVDSSRDERGHFYPSFLSDGKHFLYLRLELSAATAPTSSGVSVGALDAKPELQNPRHLMATWFGPVYVPNADHGSDRLLFLRDGTLFAQTFDARRMELTGEPVVVIDQVGGNPIDAFGFFSASSQGVLVYRPGTGRDLQLTWYDRQGKLLSRVGEPGRYGVLALSPDGAKVAVSQTDPQTGNQDIWIVDLAQGLTTRFTSDPAVDSQPVWSPDGSNIAFTSNRGGTWAVYRKSTNGLGSEELLFKSGDAENSNGENLTDWSPDGHFLLFHGLGHGTVETEWLLPLYGERKPFPWVRTGFRATGGRFSRDGHWVAYTSNETGRNEIYVQTISTSPGQRFPTLGVRHLVSKGTLGMPRWRADGKELFYLARDGKVMAVELTTTPAFHSSAPVPLFDPPADFMQAAASGFPGTLATAAADGKRFLFAVPVVQNPPEEFTAVLNWAAGLKK